MKKFSGTIIVLLLVCQSSYTQPNPLISQLKNFQQILAVTNLQFTIPKDFKEIKALHKGSMDVDYAMELPEENFQVWYLVKNTQQAWLKRRVSEDSGTRNPINPDSLYNATAQYAAMLLAGKNNFTAKNLSPDVLNTFHADRGKSYLLELYDRPETNHFQYGLLLSLQKNGVGLISMLFLSNDNGPDFYKKVNKAYYSVRFN